jgi:2-keto-4-pentenoate hydratase/2-oxohepta-3-ene-1,7-dioic acid hydratase in catechol pathway
VSAPGRRHLARVATADGAAYALLQSDQLELLDAAPWAGGRPTGLTRPRAGAVLLAPCVPGKIVCIGVNYADHAKESVSRATLPDEPVLFMKPPSAVIGPGAAIAIPPGLGRVDHEAELGLVIGRRVHRANPEAARAAIAGVVAVNDVSARELQKKDGQFTRAKGFDTFCPLGPWIALELDPGDLFVRARVNGVLRQDARSKDLACGPVDLVVFISNVMTLEPGDLISTGTPAGVGPIVPGDQVEIEIEGVGTLANPVIERT